ncbi:MAG: HEAT repeat domain-containing protein, partial [Limisphaerales bacterium]
MILNLQYGPDGSVYMIDFYEKNLCHNPDPKLYDRSNGRIYKVSYGEPKFSPINLQKLSDLELVKLQLHKNDWFVRHARRILQERAAAHGANPKVHKALLKILEKNPDVSRKLRAFWTLHVTGGLTEKFLLTQLKHRDENLRAWAIQFLCENEKPSSNALQEFARMARADSSPMVRLYLAAALQRIETNPRFEILKALLAHTEDASDQNLPLMYWWAAEPVVALDQERATTLLTNAKIPRVREFISRRLISKNENGDSLAALVSSLNRRDDSSFQLDVLNGMSDGLKGRREIKMPTEWEKISSQLSESSDQNIRALNQSLSLTFGSASALAALREQLMDRQAESKARRSALKSLLGAKDKTLAPLLQQLLADTNLRGPALRGLAAYDDARTPTEILNRYDSFSDGHKRDALNTLSSRAGFAKALLEAVEHEKLPRKIFTADLLRQLRNLKNEEVNQAVQKIWGAVREPDADKQKLIEKYKGVIQAGAPSADASRGREIFSRTCQQCHTLFGEGGKIGPDLTGSNRADLDYVLQNVVDPNA